MARRSGDHKPESALAVTGAVVAGLGILLGLVWIVAAHRIIYASLAPGLWAGSMWKLLGNFGVERWNWLVVWVQNASVNLNEVSAVQWAEFTSVAFQPLMAVLMVAYIPLLLLLAKRRASIQRKFTPDALMKLMSDKFTGNLPIVAIRKQIASNSLPGWRLPMQPEEILKKWRVPMQSVRAEWAGRAICNFKKPSFDEEVARLFFMGLRAGHGRRMDSEMLGRQVVDIMADTEHGERLVFADRCSDIGKALIALYAPVAFGGKEGRDEYAKLRDALNRSAYGTPHGMANLTVAQAQYMKWRNHQGLRGLFAVHHWEYTALFALLKRAQRFGVFPTSEILWLRPMNRILFAALNSCGRQQTPHLEGAAVYGQHQYETECAKLKRLPLIKPEEPGKPMTQVIFVEKAVGALRGEFLHLVDAVDDEDDIWLDEGIWKRTNTAVTDWAKQAEAEAAAAAIAAAEKGDRTDTPFDQLMRQQNEQAQKREDETLAAELAEMDEEL